MDLYANNEEYDGYVRDSCVFREDIDIYDKMSAQIKYANGVLVNYSLTTYSPYEGMRIAFNGMDGRIDAWDGIPWRKDEKQAQRDLHDQEMNQDDEDVDFEEIVVMDNFGGYEQIRVLREQSGHGGGDKRLQDKIFLDPNAPDPLNKPLFYGEVGDSSMLFPESVDQTSGVGLIPHLWAGLMAQDALPAQAWFWDRLLGTPQMAELASMAAFVRAADLALSWGELRAFTPEVECAVSVPHVITAGMNWGPRPTLDWTVDGSGREEAALADVPYYMVGNPDLIEKGFPDRLILRMKERDSRTLRVKLDDVGADGVTLRIRIDGEVAKDLNWPAVTKSVKKALRPACFEIDVSKGNRILSLENRGPDTIRLREIDMDDNVSALAGVGKRSPDLMVVYLWHRTQVHSAVPGDPASGFILIDDVSAGDWRVSWWDMEGRTLLEEDGISCPGGLLQLSTPNVTRHTAVILRKNP